MKKYRIKDLYSKHQKTCFLTQLQSIKGGTGDDPPEEDIPTLTVNQGGDG